MWAPLLMVGVVSISVGVSARLTDKDAVKKYFSQVSNEINDLDYKIAEGLHFMEDGETIIPNIRSYIEKVKEVTTYIDDYYDLFSQYEKLVLERGPKRWFPVHFIEVVAEERFGWTKPDFQSLNDQFKHAQNAFLNLETKCKKWRNKHEIPIDLWKNKNT